jgi:hypothetical protein
MNDLAFYNAENELTFERKRAPIGPQNWQRTAFMCLRTQVRDASGESLPLELVLALADDGQAYRRAAASRWLAGVRDSVALKKLLRRASDESPEVRANAAASLGAIGDVEAVGPVIRTLEDADRGVCNRAAESLK